MIRKIGIAAICIALALPASAQQLQQNTIYVPLKPIACNGQSNAPGGDQVHFLENYIDQQLPSPLYIAESTIWFDGITPFATSPPSASNSTGNLVVMVDAKQTYINQAGFPDAQHALPKTLKKLTYIQFAPGTAQFRETQHNPPVKYDLGDAILAAQECIGGKLLTDGFLLAHVQMTGNIEDLPMADQPLSVAHDGWTGVGGQAGVSARDIVPGPTVAPSTQVRARVSYPEGATPAYSNTTHVSICPQSGVTSTCSSAPIELKFNKRSGSSTYVRTQIWSDWTPYTVTVGQPSLVTADLFNANNANYLAYKSTGSFGGWTSNAASWNASAMQGTVSFSAGATAVIDRVQYR